MSDSMMQSNAGSGRRQNNQNGLLPSAGQDSAAFAQGNRQQPQMARNALSQALPGDQLSTLQALLGMNTNTGNVNPNIFNSSLGLGSELELKLRQLGMHPSQQRQQPSQFSSMMQSSRADSGEDNSGKVSVPSRSAAASTYSSGASISQPDQTKRVVRVPCRARGMSMDHNFQTAYFEISGSMQHGDGLICSFPECRNRGIKFLYCAVCKDPVAKRNFRNRHTHEDNVNSSDRPFKMQKMTKSVPSSRPNTNAPNASKAPHEVSEGAGSSNNGSGEGWPSNSNNLVSRQTAMLPRKRPHYLKEIKKRSAAAAAMSSESDTISQEKSARMDTKRIDAWTMLLAERPSTDQSDAMSKWLMKVMAVSDLKKSTAQAIAVAKAGNSDVGSSNEGSNDGSNDGASPGDESSPTDDSSPAESSSDDTGQNVKKMSSSKPTSSNDASNEDSSPTNSNDSSNDSSSDNQDEDMDIKEIWIRD